MGLGNNAFRSNTQLGGGWLWKFLNLGDDDDTPSAGVYHDGSFTGPQLPNGRGRFSVRHPTYGDGGAKGNGTTNDRSAFVDADTAAQASGGGALEIEPGTYSISSSVTIASGVRFMPGGIIKPASGTTVTITGPIEAGQHQLFDVSAGGTVVVRSAERLLPQWWGARADGTTDDTAEIAAWITACGTSGIPGHAPQGTYLVSTHTLVTSSNNIALSGDGIGLTRFKMASGAVDKDVDVYILGFRNTSGFPITVSLRDMTFNMNGSGNPYAPDTAADFQGQHALRFQPTSARGMRLVIHNVQVLEPIADAMSISRAGGTYSEIILSNIAISGRDYSTGYNGRTDITLNCLFDEMVVTNVTADSFQLENGLVDDDHEMSLHISNSDFYKRFDVVFKSGETVLPFEPQCTISNCTLRGVLNFANFRFFISNCVLKTWIRTRLTLGRYKFSNCFFFGQSSDEGEDFEGVTQGFFYSLSGTVPLERSFHNCVFDVEDGITTTEMPYYVFSVGPADTGEALLRFKDCDFRGPIQPMSVRSVDLELIGNTFEFDGRQVGRTISTIGRTYRAIIKGNVLYGGSSATICEWQGNGDPYIVVSEGNVNTVVHGQIYTFDSDAEAVCTFVKMDDAYGEKTLASSATIQVSGGRYWVTGDTTAVTTIKGSAGHRFTIRFAHAKTITQSATIQLHGSTNFNGAVGDTLTLEKRGSVWYEVARSVVAPGPDAYKGLIETTNATITTGLQVLLADATVYFARAHVVAVETDGSNRAAYVREAFVYRTGGGSATLQGSVGAVLTTESDAAWDCSMDVSGNAVRVRVTGAADTTINWRTVMTLYPVGEAE